MTNSLTKLYFHVDVGHHVHLHVSHHRVVSTLCEGLETLTEWKKCDGPTNQPNGLTGVGARDTCASRNYKLADLKCICIGALHLKRNAGSCGCLDSFNILILTNYKVQSIFKPNFSSFLK